MTQSLSSPPCEDPFIELATALRNDVRDERAEPGAG
jgi:hypothetical protein